MSTVRTLLVCGLILLFACVCGGQDAGVIPWDKAAEHVGETRTVEGPVVDTKYASTSRGTPTFLNVGKSYPDPARFTVVIWGRNRNKFPELPEVLYRGRTIRVTGLISIYRGSPQIEVTEPSAISIVR